MNILELNSYNLADAVKFNDKLNPRIWEGEKMRPEVREKLLEIAEDFREFLGVDNLDVKDITVSGSNASYHYTPYSDIDLHLVVDVPQLKDDAIFRELFDAKKYQYNDLHDIKIGGYDVELYVEDSNTPPVSQGIFSVKNNDWINIPKQRRATVDDTAVKSKYEDIKHRIEAALKDKDFDRIDALAKKIKTMRQAGLDAHGEFGPENLAFKMLRTQGFIGKLYDARNAARDAELSLVERKKKKKKVKYGFARTWGPVYDFSDGGEGGDGGIAEDVTVTPDGVSPSTKMFLSEQDPVSDEDILKDFISFVAKELKIKELPAIKLRRDPQWSVVHKTFGRYMDEKNTLEVAWGQRHIMDVLRTVAHELTHRRQHEREDVPMSAGETGSPYENEANARAGILMRDYARLHPEYFEAGQAQELHGDEIHEASGYIPTKKQARDPRYKMALTVDVHPGQTGREANKMALETDSQGKPALLIKSANLLKEFQEFKEGLLEDQDLFEVKMTGKNLAKLASDIKGAKVGLEFEMIVPNVNNEDSDQEPDYDQDERVRDIDDAVSFFDDGDYNSSREIRRLREQMESDYFDWQTEQIDQDWHNHGFEFFQEYLDREEPFDEEEYLERARDMVAERYPEITAGTDEYDDAVREALNEINAEYYTETWAAEGRSYDNAREEFEDEKRDEYTESAWLDDRGIRYASDVQNEYSDVQWPYWSSPDGGESDIETVALDFMNAMGMDSVAISSSYHGSYKKWMGSGWVSIGSNKPDDCFTIEPDGSLEGDDRTDTGLEFVSPPIPLEDIGTVMSKVQNWAGNYGAYTGLNNKTSIHTNISIPGYDLDKLDYLKAALLLGDEYVLREFDRIGNTYAAPAIEKVKALVKQNPDKAKQLLDKMKSQLNAEASKLIHSGQTNKFTSINTKDNRVEFRSPGGDYLSIIADNPQKMVDTINRMVVTLDAAMDPNKYKEEYQKKLYKVLTGQETGREAKSGAKKEMKKDDKDLLNIFSRYAAGELPKAALKSFVRQAQLERKGKKADAALASHNWAIRRRDGGDIVRTFQADNYMQAFDILQQYKQKHNITDDSLTYGPYNPSNEKPAEQGGGLYKIFDTNGSLIAGDEYGSDRAALARAGVWAMRRGVDVVVKNAQGQEIGRVSASGEITPSASSRDEEPLRGGSGTGPYEIYNRETGEMTYQIDPDAASNDQEALDYLENYRNSSTRPSNYGVRRAPVPGSTLDLQRQRAAQAQTQQSAVNTPPPNAGMTGNWGLWMTNNDRFARWPGYPTAAGQEIPLRRFETQAAAEEYLNSLRETNPRVRTDVEVREIPLDYQSPPPVGRQVMPQAQQSGVNNLTPHGPGPWELYNTQSGEVFRRLEHTNRAAAETEAETYYNLYSSTLGDISNYGVRTRQQSGGTINTANEPTTGSAVGQTYSPSGTGSFTGQWLILNPDNQVIYRFGGIGNSQSDANRHAMNWLSRNPRQMQDGVTVVPEMG